MKYSFVKMVAVFAACLSLSAFAAITEVGKDMVLQIDDSNVGDYSGGLKFTDAGGVVEFSTSSAPTMDITGERTSGYGIVRKVNDASWTLTKQLDNFFGDYEIHGGVVTYSVKHPFGMEGFGKVVIKSGATLVAANFDRALFTRTLHLSGTGVDGRGALEIAADISSNVIREFVLDDDALITFKNGKYIFIDGTANPNGHRLTLSGYGTLYLQGTLSASGEVYCAGAASNQKFTFSYRGGTIKSGTDPIVFAGNVNFDIYTDNKTPVERPLYLSGSNDITQGEQFESRYGFCWSAQTNVWAGPITFTNTEGVSVLNVNAGYNYRQITLGGPIAGPGRISIYYSSRAHYGRTYLNGENSTFSGGFSYSGYYADITKPRYSQLLVGCPTSFGNAGASYASVTGDYQHVDCEVAADGSRWDFASFKKLAAEATWLHDCFPMLCPNYSETMPELEADGGIGRFWGATGPIALKVTGADGFKNLTWRYGDLHLRGTATPFGLEGLQLYGGGSCLFEDKPIHTSITLDGGAVVPLGKDVVRIGGLDSATALGSARLIVKDASLVATNAVRPTSYEYIADYALGVGPSDKPGYGGILELHDGALVSNKLVVGGCRVGTADTWRDGNGAVYQFGGKVYSIGCGNSAAHLDQGVGMDASRGSYGAYELHGGTFEADNNYSIGGYSLGIWTQYGGTAKFTTSVPNAYFGIAGGNGGQGVIAIRGGSFTVANTFYCSRASLNGAFAHLVVDGPTATAGCGEYVTQFLNSSGGTDLPAFFEVNNGGVFTTARLYRGAPGKVYFGFDGGTLRAGATYNDLLGWFSSNGADQRPTRVTVYPGGMTVDTDGKKSNKISTNILGPSEKGVTAVTMAEPLVETGLLGSPLVLIEGDGEGASAIAEFDPVLGAVTNIHVTAAGVNYTTATAKVYIRTVKSGVTPIATYPCVVGTIPNTGSFTKAGAETLTLSGTNSWGGATILRGGTLAIGSDGALPSGTRIQLAGGMISCPDAYASTLPTAWEVDVNDVRAGGTVTYGGALRFPVGSTITVRNLDTLCDDDPQKIKILTVTGDITNLPALETPGLPEGWRCKWVGNSLVASKITGLLMLVR